MRSHYFGGLPYLDVEQAMPVLDIGCGRNKAPGAIGIDKIALPGVDIVHDLNSFPYPFGDSSFDEIYATHVIEHLDTIVGAMEEIHRLAKPNAKVVFKPDRKGWSHEICLAGS